MLKPERHAWGLLGSCGFKARKQSPEVGRSSPRIPEQGGGIAGLASGLLACQPRALLSILPLTPRQGPDVQFDVNNHRSTTCSPVLPLSPLILILQAPEVGGEGGGAVMGFGAGKGRGEAGKLKTPEPQTNPLPFYRMTVMSLLVLVLSWGSMGLEAATAVVSNGGWAPGPWGRS